MSEYKSTYTGAQIDAGIALANTALQEHQSLAAYRTSSDQDTIDSAQNTNITNLQTGLGTAEGNITTLQGNMTTAQGNISTLQTRVGQLGNVSNLTYTVVSSW